MSNVKFVGKDKDDKDVTCYVRRPNAKDFKEAKLYSNSGVAKAIKSGNFITRSQTKDHIIKAGIWTNEQEVKLVEITNTITENLNKLKLGGIKKSAAKAICLELIGLRDEQMLILSRVNELDKFTIEAQAENDEFDYLVSACLLSEEGDRVFESVDQYKENATEQPYYFSAGEELQKIIYGYGKVDEILKARPEYQFLIKEKIVDDTLRYIDKDGNLVARYGNVVDENGDLVNNNQGDGTSEQAPVSDLGEFLDD